MENQGIIAIGWDVRGWRGNQQAVAILEISPQDPVPKWLGISPLFQIPPNKNLSLSTLIEPTVKGLTKELLCSNKRIVIGIDAPLAFPKSFGQLATSMHGDIYLPPEREIDNIFAYRECERWVYQEYGKKPLSATFNLLGNNATLAMYVANRLKLEGFNVIPQDRGNTERVIIEVYPGIIKKGQNKTSRAISPIERYIPTELKVGSDQYDAAICAILAAVYAGGEEVLELPPLIDFDPKYNHEEGWIYGFSPAYIKSYI